MPYTWTTNAQGLVTITMPAIVEGGPTSYTPKLAGAQLAQLRAVHQRWGAVLTSVAQKTKVPIAWLEAIATAESGGDPTAVSPAGAVGLMQIIPAGWQGHTRAEMMNGTINAQVAGDILATLRKTKAALSTTPEGVGGGLPAVASLYNAGGGATNTPHPSASSPWGMRENAGYIDNVVAGNNSAILDRGATTGTAPGGGGASLAVPLLGLLAAGLLLRSR